METQCFEPRSDKVMAKFKQFFEQNFIYICIAAACLSLLLYLIAFSCELSRILDSRRTTTDTSSIFLSIIYFVHFLSATILINGLATRLFLGLLIWAAIFSTLTIPELWLIMMQFWGMDSNHGLTEVICYFVRLIINCMILIHIVPLALKWRKEKKILKQLESLASRLQLTTTPANNFGNFNGTIQRAASIKDIENAENDTSFQEANHGEKSIGGIDNNGYLQSYYGSQNEFDASIFGMNPSQYIGPPVPNNLSKRTKSLLDLRFINTTTLTAQIVAKTKDKSDSVSLNSYDMRLQNNLSKNAKSNRLKGSKEQMFHTMEPQFKKSLGRNCVSLENLGLYVTDDGLSGNFPCYPPVYPAYFYYNHPYQHQPFFTPYHNNYLPNQNSAYFNQSSSIGNPSLDDFRKYRDVAL